MSRTISLFLSIVAMTIFSAGAATVTGTVTDNTVNQNPVAAAIVTLTVGGAAGTVLRDTTDAQGTYTITNVTAAAYPTTVSMTVTKSGYNNATANGIRIAAANSVVTRDFTLVPRAAGVTVSGIVTNAANANPIEGVKVVLRDALTATDVDSAVTGTNGRYTIDSVAPGTYQLIASITGYATQTVRVTVANAAVTQNIQLSAIVVSILRGKVTNDSSAGPGVAGVTVVITQTTGGTSVDTATTDANGWYIDSVTGGARYNIAASKTGYTGAQANHLQTAGPDTVSIVIRKIITTTLRGKITSDSTNGPAVAGATVTVTRNGTTAGTDVTDATGWYEITGLQAGIAYSVSAAMTGYTTRTVTNQTLAANADTVSIAIVKLPSGNLHVVVLKRTDSTAIAGASVTATENGIGAAGSYTGTSGANGFASFTGIGTGTYAISITAANYTAGTATATVRQNANDTVKVYLTVSATGTKVLKGTVTDSVSGSALANARVVLTLAATAGGTAITIVDSTNAQGQYLIGGIPANRNAGTVTATLTGYRTYTNAQVTIGQMNTADTATLNIKLRAVVEVVGPSAIAAGKLGFSAAGSALQLRNVNDQARVSVFSVNGRLVFQANVAAHTTSLALPKALSGVYLISITQKNAVYRNRVILK